MLFRQALLVAICATFTSCPGAAVANVWSSDPGDWYGWQTATVDLVGDGILIGAAVERSATLTSLGVGVTLIVPPLIHVAHGDNGIALFSFGLRVGLPLASVGIGQALEWSSQFSDRSCCHGLQRWQVALYSAMGLLGAQAIDIFALAVEDSDNPGARPRIVSIVGSF